jgi:hypothetical protein
MTGTTRLRFFGIRQLDPSPRSLTSREFSQGGLDEWGL